MKSAKQKGFTIVELLVVIVVIGILAAITMVSYSGVTTKAKATAAQSNAVSVKSVIETYYADNGLNAGNGVWPANAGLVNNYSNGATALVKLPTGVTLSAGTVALSAAAGSGDKTVTYMQNTGATGGCIAYYNYSASAPFLSYFYVGSATAGTEGTGATLGQMTACI